jgi:error-prone DNA polymerase
MGFVHLHVHTPWSYLDGAQDISDLVQAAGNLGMKALAVTDHNNVSAAVRFYHEAVDCGIKPIQGSEVSIEGLISPDTHHLILLAQNPKGYANLCRILTSAHLNHLRGEPKVEWELLSGNTSDIIALSGCRRGEIPSLILRGRKEEAREVARKCLCLFGPDRFFIELQSCRLPHTHSLNQSLTQLAQDLGIECVATNNVHFAHKAQFPLHDILTCVRLGITLDDIHRERALNAENYLKSPQEMAETFPGNPRAVAMSEEIAERCEPVIVPKRRLFPQYRGAEGVSAAQLLRERTYRGASEKYGKIKSHIRERLEYELDIIGKVGVEDYFLAVLDLVDQARKLGIRFCGRGSSSNSAVAYALGISSVDPIERDLFFERFLSVERSNMPDFDIDVEADRRDELINYVYKRYGQSKVGMVCTFSTYKARSVIRDFGKVMGFPQEEIDQVAKAFPHIHADRINQALDTFPELLQAPIDFSRYERLFCYSQEAAGFPRHISTHLGGIVICKEPLDIVSPLQKAAKGVNVIQFDKEDVESLGLIKLDLLSLRTLSVIRTALDSLEAVGVKINYEKIPTDDRQTLDMIDRGQTVGVFQLESPAQRGLQSKLDITAFEDVVASIALMRPGPVKGNMVGPFIARRCGREEVSFADKRLEPILSRTYGVVLYQEQVLQIAVAIAGFTPGEADNLRRAMSDCRSEKQMRKAVASFVDRAVAGGCDPQVAKNIAATLLAYAGYGFCQGHAEAFACTAYRTAYLMRYYPAFYLAALMSHQPVGFYPTRTLCIEAHRNGINMLHPDINKSGVCFTVEEEGKFIRTSLMQIRQVKKLTKKIVSEREKNGLYQGVLDFCQRVRPNRDALSWLILAGAFDAFNNNRRQMMWSVDRLLHAAKLEGGLHQSDQSILGANKLISDYPQIQRAKMELEALGFLVEGPPIRFIRPELKKEGVLTTDQLASVKAKEIVSVAGIVVRLQRPPDRSVLFFTLEDEEGFIDVTVSEKLYQKEGYLVYAFRVLKVKGRLNRQKKGISLVATHIRPLNTLPLQEDYLTGSMQTGPSFFGEFTNVDTW